MCLVSSDLLYGQDVMVVGIEGWKDVYFCFWVY